MLRVSQACVVLLLLAVVPAPGFAQTFDRGWIDVNAASVTPAQDTQSYSFRGPLFQETLTLSSAYPKLPRASGGLIGGGFGVTSGLGFAVQFINAKYTYTVGLGASVPHPAFFNRLATDTDVTSSSLERKDNAVDLSAVYQLPTPDNLRVRVFGGPTYFSVKQEMVDDVRYLQVFNVVTGANIVNIQDFTKVEVDESTWGFHVGADVSYFFSRHVGVGGGARFNRGTVSLDREPLSEQPAELKAGGTIVNGGLRLRF